MFKSFRVLFFFCVGFSVVQVIFTEHYDDIDDNDHNTEYPDYMFTPPSVCAPNEILECRNTCSPELSCRDHREQVTTVPCLEEEQSCEDKCVCEPGYFRNSDNGVCITEKQCYKCPGPNEHFACGGPCDNICHTIHLQNKTSCPYTDCHPSCYCDDGYARDASGVCIPIHECPIPKCGQNEVFTECKKSCNDTCSGLMNPFICDSEEQCGDVGCVCKDGYLRIEENAPCLPICECPQKEDSPMCWYTGKTLSYYLNKLQG